MVDSIITFYTQNSQNDFNTQLYSGRVVAHVPVETNCPDNNCGWDPVTQSAIRFDCPTCNGRGKIVSDMQYHLFCRISWAGMVKFAYPAPTIGVEMGDCNITVNSDFKFAMDLVLESERAYLTVDGKTVRPRSMQPQIVQNAVREYEYVCYEHTPADY